MLGFPLYEISDVPSKIDTGAYRSALHATNITEKDGVLSFNIMGKHPLYKGESQVISMKKYRKVWVTNSFGSREERYEVKLRTKIGSRIFNASFSLADRSKNTYPILIGREILTGRFIVDTSVLRIKRKQLEKLYGAVLPHDEEEKD